jgi:hypothetical protein
MQRNHSLLPRGEGGRGTRPDEGCLPPDNPKTSVFANREPGADDEGTPSPTALRSPLSPRESATLVKLALMGQRPRTRAIGEGPTLKGSHTKNVRRGGCNPFRVGVKAMHAYSSRLVGTLCSAALSAPRCGITYVNAYGLSLGWIRSWLRFSFGSNDRRPC